MNIKFESPNLRITKAELDEYELTVKEIQGENVYDYLISSFEKTVKKDRRSIELGFTHLLSAYSSDPSNLGLDAPSSEGKTYPIVEVAKHFPIEDIWFLGGLSPTALVHDFSVLVDKNDEPLKHKLEPLYHQVNVLKKSKEGGANLEIIKNQIAELIQGSKYLINLENKILIFLEPPSLETWEKLRPILSHDVSETSYKFADRSLKGRLKTMHVVIRGWPAAVYFKAGRGREDVIWPQIQTRFTTISPRMTAEKYRAAIQFGAMRKGLPSVIFDHKIGMGEFERVERIIRTIRRRLLDIKYKARKASKNFDPNTFWIPFYKKIGEGFPASVGRHMRDSKRFITVMQMSAAANVFARPMLKIDGGEYIVVVREDYERAIRLFFEEAGEEIFTGIPGHIIDFFKHVILPLWRREEPEHEKVGGGKAKDTTPREGITVNRIVNKCTEVYHKGRSANTIRQHYLPPLENYGLITSESDPNNKSQNLWSVLHEEIQPKDTHIHTLFKSGGGFSPEMLKRELNDLNATPPHEPLICNNKGESINVDQLWNEYYIFTPSGGGVQLSAKKASMEEHPKENTPEIEKGESGRELKGHPQAEPTAQDLEKAILAYPSKTQISRAKLAGDLGVSPDRLNAVIEDLRQKHGKVIDRGSMVEVV